VPTHNTRKMPPMANHQERPRERLLAHGVAALTAPELLAIVLRTGTAGCDAVALGRHLIQHFNGLRGLLSANVESLLAVRGLGAAKTCELLAISELSRRGLREELATRHVLQEPQAVKQLCAAELAHLKVEHCIALYLDNQNRLVATEHVSQGTLTQTSVYPREIVKAALHHHASAVILAHNHPSGVAAPSRADLSLTHRLKQALALVDVTLLDHIIVANAGVVSLAETGGFESTGHF